MLAPRPLNLSDADRQNCSIVFNVNRFELYHANGWLMSATSSPARLDEILGVNQIDAAFNDMAKKMYLVYQQ